MIVNFYHTNRCGNLAYSVILPVEFVLVPYAEFTKVETHVNCLYLFRKMHRILFDINYWCLYLSKYNRHFFLLLVLLNPFLEFRHDHTCNCWIQNQEDFNILITLDLGQIKNRTPTSNDCYLLHVRSVNS